MKNIHVLPTDKPSRLKQNNITKKISLVNKGIDLTAYTPINIYITSDEEIKEGDYYITILDNEVYKATKETQNIMSVANLIGTTTYKNTHFKIILTDNKDLIKDGVQAIDDEFLEWFVKNSSCEEVEVEDWYNKFLSCCRSKQECHCNKKRIIIPKEEPKQETPEEIAQRYYEDEVSINAFINGYKIAQEFLCNHNHILTSEQGHRVIKCSKCNDTQPI